jgi:hypothetical protein
MPAAADVVHAEHRKTEQVIRRKIAEVSGGMDNLMRVLERTQDPDGQLFARTSARMAELESDLAQLDMQLRRHLAAAPPEPEQNSELLAQLPHAEVDLNALAGDRPQRFLDAFTRGDPLRRPDRAGRLPRGDQWRDARSAHATDPSG